MRDLSARLRDIVKSGKRLTESRVLTYEADLAVPATSGVAKPVVTTKWSTPAGVISSVSFSEEGVVSVQVTLGTTALLAALTVGVRLLRRGERRVG